MKRPSYFSTFYWICDNAASRPFLLPVSGKYLFSFLTRKLPPFFSFFRPGSSLQGTWQMPYTQDSFDMKLVVKDGQTPLVKYRCNWPPNKLVNSERCSPRLSCNCFSDVTDFWDHNQIGKVTVNNLLTLKVILLSDLHVYRYCKKIS